MKAILTIFFFVILSVKAKADDRWIILVNGERVFQCVSTCAANGFNANLLKAKVKLKPGDKITVVYNKDSNEAGITKNIIVSDSAQGNFQSFSVADPDGTHAITLMANDFNSMNKIILWYSEKKVINGREVYTQRVPLVYFE